MAKATNRPSPRLVKQTPPVQATRRAVFTICSNNYLAFARTLLDSLAKHEPQIDRFLILADRKIAPEILYPDNATIICVEDLNIPDFPQFAFRYDVMEFNTAIKPTAALHLLEKRGYSSVIYLDPDIEVFAPLQPVNQALEDGASVVLTPHICNPAEGDVIPGDVQFLQAGTYNLGFCAWSNNVESLSTLRWWERRLAHQCVNEVARGLFVDQKFIDLVPGFLQNVSICREPTLNVAYWNLSQRDLQHEDGAWVVDGQPLIFFHFSGFLPAKLDVLSKHTPMFHRRQISPSLRELMQLYAQKLFDNGYGRVPAGTYPWAHFNSGARIHPSIRKMFRERHDDWQDDPFETFEAALHSGDQAGDQADDQANPVSAHMLYLRDGLNWLQFMYDPNSPEGAKALARWYLETIGPDWEMDARLLAPTVERLGNRSPLTAPSLSTAGRRDISLVGYLKTVSGVGEIARRTLRTLTTMPFSIEAKDVGLKVGGARSEALYDGLDTEEISGRVQIFNINADQITPVLAHLGKTRWPDAYKIAIPFWELDAFPARFADDLKAFDELWATSTHIQALLYRQFPDKPVILMPPDLTPAMASSRTRGSFGLPEDAFLVFFSFDFLSQLERKNPKGAHEAFKRAFGDRPNARFVLKTLNGQYAPEAYHDWHVELLADPQVIIIDDRLSHEDVLALIKCCNVVLSLHRGEGLGLLIADAIGQNVPVISTDWSGTTDLVGPRSGYPVHYRLVPTPVDAYPYVDGHQWAEPDIDHAAWQLLQVYGDQESANAKARQARADLVSRFGPGRAGQAMSQRLKAILSPLETNVREGMQDGQ